MKCAYSEDCAMATLQPRYCLFSLSALASSLPLSLSASQTPLSEASLREEERLFQCGCLPACLLQCVRYLSVAGCVLSLILLLTALRALVQLAPHPSPF